MVLAEKEAEIAALRAQLDVTAAEREVAGEREIELGALRQVCPPLGVCVQGGSLTW